MGKGGKGKNGGNFMTPRFLHQAIDLIENAIIITDTSGTILYLNKRAQKLFGYGVKASLGKSIGMLFLPDDLTHFLPNILKKSQLKGGYKGENLLRDRNNTRVFVRLATSLYRGENTDGNWIVFTIQDITKLKELERNYYESQRLASLGRMVEEIAHKIRNPVVSIGGFAKRISKKISQGNQLQYFKMIQEEVRSLEGIVDQVQGFATLPKSVYNKQSIREIIEGSLKSISANASRKRVLIDFEMEKPNWSPTVFIDGGLLARALRYILDNAIEAIDGEGSIHVKLFSKGHFIGIEISDSGCGISEEHLGAIFDPFFTTKPSKVGISLATAHRIIKEQGGTIQVSSKQGKGACFTIFLPKERRRKIRTGALS
ncbi:MAG: PAS domain S-box protein [Syntrophobacterales bacterium]|nr:MAG: PAS domain S-box protein [Syntrophobacterales bacterium]